MFLNFRGADIDETDENNLTPLEDMLGWNLNDEIVDALCNLIDAGADLSYAFERPARFIKNPILIEKLIKNGADVEHRSFGLTPIVCVTFLTNRCMPFDRVKWNLSNYSSNMALIYLQYAIKARIC